MLGLVLLFVPTLWGLFPGFADWHVGWLLLVLALWLGSAVWAVAAEAKQSDQLGELIGAPLKLRHQQRQIAGAALLAAVLPPKTGLLAGYEFRVFAPEPEGDRLTSIFASEGTRTIEWEVGRGATGKAWELESYVVARGAGCSDGTHDLTPDEQAMYANLQLVASIPVLNARSRPIAVLTASSEIDNGDVDEPGFQEELIVLRAIVARVLIDVMCIAVD